MTAALVILMFGFATAVLMTARHFINDDDSVARAGVEAVAVENGADPSDEAKAAAQRQAEQALIAAVPGAVAVNEQGQPVDVNGNVIPLPPGVVTGGTGTGGGGTGGSGGTGGTGGGGGSGGTDPLGGINDTLDGTVGTVNDTLNDTVGTVNDTLGTVNDTVGDVTDTVNDLPLPVELPPVEVPTVELPPVQLPPVSLPQLPVLPGLQL